jgi:hypothetical protein
MLSRTLSLALLLTLIAAGPVCGEKWCFFGRGLIRQNCGSINSSCGCQPRDATRYCLKSLDFTFLSGGQQWAMYECTTYLNGCDDPGNVEDDLYDGPYSLVSKLPENCPTSPEQPNPCETGTYGCGCRSRGVHCCQGHGQPLWTKPEAKKFIDMGLAGDHPAGFEHCFYRIPSSRSGLCRPVYVLIVTLRPSDGSSEPPRYFGVETRRLLPPMDPATFSNDARVGPGAQLTIDYSVAGESRHAHIWLERK